MPQAQLSPAVQAAAAQLGITNVSNEEVLQLCTEMADGTVLPAGWSKGYDTQRNKLYFVDEVKRDTSWVHPLLAYYSGAVFMALGGRQALLLAEANKPCTEQEVRDMAGYLGIDLELESGLLDIARMAVAAPVPSGWQQIDSPDGYAVFRNAQTGQEQEAHPLDDYFTELIRRRRMQPPGIPASSPLTRQPSSSTALQPKPLPKPSPLSKPQVSASPTSNRSSDSGSYTDDASEHSEADVSPAARRSPGSGASSDVDNSEGASDSPADDVEQEEGNGQSGSLKQSVRQVTNVISNVQNTSAVSSAALQQFNQDSPTAWKQERLQPTMSAASGLLTSDADPPQSTERMHVAVRARPIPASNSPSCWIIDTAAGTIVQNPNAVSPKRKQAGLLSAAAAAASVRDNNDWEVNSMRSAAESRVMTPSSRSTVFKFDSVLDDTAKTEEAYARCIKSMVHSALQGVNATVLAYGQTGSGKTHTIMGERNEPGAISLAIDDLFAFTAAASGDAYSFKVDMVEIYNEDLRDLLAPLAGKQKKAQILQIKEDSLMGVRVSGAYQEVVSDAARMKQLFQRGNSRRQTSSHNLNTVSSRSHAIFQIMIQCRRADSSVLQVSTLNFVDLAGSEKIEKSGSEFEAARTREAASINVSLLMLGNVISKLAERSMGSVTGTNLSSNRLGSPARTAHSSPDHIPYRNSKLTRLLQPSLGGNARTAIIATINPSADQADETYHTLRLASRAMAVTNHISVNHVMSDSDLAKQYQAELKRLRHSLSKRSSGVEESAAVYTLKQQVRRLEDQNMALGLQLESSTGRPAQDWVALPATPPDLNLPSQWSRVSRRPTSPEQALKLIARTTALNRPTPTSQPPNGMPSTIQPSPDDRLYGRASADDVVQSVRRLRAERDQLRLRDRDHSRHMHQVEDQLLELDQLQHQLPLIEQATSTLEDLVGISDPAANPIPVPKPSGRDLQQGNRNPSSTPLPERLEQAVAAASIVAAEMQSMHRQLVTSGLLLQQEEARAAQLQADLVQAKQASQTQAAAPGQGQSSATALQLVKVLQQQVANLETRLTAQDKTRKELTKELLQWCSLQPAEGQPRATPVGSAAVMQAHQATRRAQSAERQLEAAVAERDSLARQVQELKPPELPDQDTVSNGEARPSAEDQLQRLRKKVYALSSEVAHLTRERDILRVQVGQPPGPTLPFGSVQLQPAALSMPSTAAVPRVPQSSSAALSNSPGMPLYGTAGQASPDRQFGSQMVQLTAETSAGSLSSARGLRSLFNFHKPLTRGSLNSPRATRHSPGKKKFPGPKLKQQGVRGSKHRGPDGDVTDWSLAAKPSQGSQLVAEGSGKAGWVDPTGSQDTPAKQLVALRQRLVTAERDRKQSLADAAAENRALQLQLQRAEKAAQQAGQLDQQLAEAQAQQTALTQLNQALQAQSAQDAAQLKLLVHEKLQLRG